jgi:hypothetical protein
MKQWTLGGTPQTAGEPAGRPVPIQNTTQHRKPRTNVHALSGIRTHVLRVQAIEARASDCAATGAGSK